MPHLLRLTSICWAPACRYHRLRSQSASLRHGYTLVLIVFSWVLFWSEALTYAPQFVSSMFDFASGGWLDRRTVHFLLEYRLNTLITSYGENFYYLGLPLQSAYFYDRYPDYLENRKWHIDAMTAETTIFTLPPDDVSAVTCNVFMGGDSGETVLRTKRPELPHLLILGDSFTNPMETLFYTGFNETRILDLRHYMEMGILAYMEQYQPDTVLCIRDNTAYYTVEGNGNIS